MFGDAAGWAAVAAGLAGLSGRWRLRGQNQRWQRRTTQLSSLAFYDNNLHPDPTERKAVNSHVLALIDAAVLLGVPTVGTFVGRDPTKSVADNLREAEQVFRQTLKRIYVFFALEVDRRYEQLA